MPSQGMCDQVPRASPWIGLMFSIIQTSIGSK
jgi:hypothetical protein